MRLSYEASIAATLLRTEIELLEGALFSLYSFSLGGLSAALILLVNLSALEVVGLGVATFFTSPDVFLDTDRAGVASADDFLERREDRDEILGSGVEVLVGLLMPDTPDAAVKPETEPMESLRAAAAELGGLVVPSVNLALLMVEGATGVSNESTSVFRADSAREFR